MDLEDSEEEIDEGVDPCDVDDDTEGPHAAGTLLGAAGQLAAAVIVVAILVAVFIGASAVLRRLFG